jgi:hypothetical protein
VKIERVVALAFPVCVMGLCFWGAHFHPEHAADEVGLAWIAGMLFIRLLWAEKIRKSE